MDKLEIGGATALVGAAVFQIHSQYTTHAGSLADAREASMNDPKTRQRISDADVLTGGLVLLVGGSVSYFTRSVVPIAIAIIGFGLISVYYHAALTGPALAVPVEIPTQMDGET